MIEDRYQHKTHRQARNAPCCKEHLGTVIKESTIRPGSGHHHLRAFWVVRRAEIGGEMGESPQIESERFLMKGRCNSMFNPIPARAEAGHDAMLLIADWNSSH